MTETATPTAEPPPELEVKKTRPRSNSEEEAVMARASSARAPKKTVPTDVQKAASSRDGPRKKVSTAPANKNPRSKGTRRGPGSVTASVNYGAPSQWDPLGTGNNKTSVSSVLSPRISPSVSAYGHPELVASDPGMAFNSFLTQSVPGYTAPYATHVTPFSPRADRPVSMMLTTSNPFATNPNPFSTNSRATVNFGAPSVDPFSAAGSSLNPRATTSFGTPYVDHFGTSNMFATNPISSPFATGAGTRATVSYGATSFGSTPSFGSSGQFGPFATGGSAPLSPVNSSTIFSSGGTANPFATNPTSNPFLAPVGGSATF